MKYISPASQLPVIIPLRMFLLDHPSADSTLMGTWTVTLQTLS